MTNTGKVVRLRQPATRAGGIAPTRTSVVMKLTKEAIDRATHAVVDGAPRQRLYFDRDTKGFACVVGTTAKTFVLQYAIGRKTARHKIGSYGDWTVDQARKEASRLRVELDKGVDPAAAKRAKETAELTLRDALKRYQAELTVEKKSPDTIDGYARLLERYSPKLLDRPLVELKRADVIDIHRRIPVDIRAGRYLERERDDGTRYRLAVGERTGEAAANKWLRALRAVYNHALREDEAEALPRNPAAQVTLYKVETKGKAIAREQLPTWYAAVLKHANHARRDCLRFMLLTGLRSESARAIRWEHVDLKAGTLLVPTPKGGKDRGFTLPLPAPLVTLLKRRRAADPTSPFVFAAGGEKGYLQDARLDVDGIAWRPHDLRFTFATVAESIGTDPYALKMLLNHALPKARDVTSGYVTMTTERLREPMERIVAEILRIATAKPAAKRKGRA